MPAAPVLGTTVPDRIVALDDFDVELAAMLREYLFVPGMGETTARRFRDKLAMRRRARSGGLPCPTFVHTLNDAEITSWTSEVPAPWVLKPRAQAAALGIRRIAAALQRGVEPVATRHGATIAQVVLAWLLAQPAVTSVVVGASWPDQARANAEAAGLELSAEERLAIHAVFEQLELDPYAGLGVARRIYTRGRRAAGR